MAHASVCSLLLLRYQELGLSDEVHVGVIFPFECVTGNPLVGDCRNVELV